MTKRKKTDMKNFTVVIYRTAQQIMTQYAWGRTASFLILGWIIEPALLTISFFHLQCVLCADS